MKTISNNEAIIVNGGICCDDQYFNQPCDACCSLEYLEKIYAEQHKQKLEAVMKLLLEKGANISDAIYSDGK